MTEAWIIFTIIATSLIVVSIPVLQFPRYLPCFAHLSFLLVNLYSTI
jgi:hypothetical protein